MELSFPSAIISLWSEAQPLAFPVGQIWWAETVLTFTSLKMSLFLPVLKAYLLPNRGFEFTGFFFLFQHFRYTLLLICFPFFLKSQQNPSSFFSLYNVPFFPTFMFLSWFSLYCWISVVDQNMPRYLFLYIYPGWGLLSFLNHKYLFCSMWNFLAIISSHVLPATISLSSSFGTPVTGVLDWLIFTQRTWGSVHFLYNFFASNLQIK